MADNMPKPIINEYFAMWIMLAQAKNTILKARQREYSQFNITDERRRVLWSILNIGGRATPVEISHHLLLELHSVTMMLNRMEKEGLVKKGKSTSRSRSVIELTTKGLAVFNQSRYNETDKKIFSVLSKQEQEQLMSSLWKVRNQALKELGIPIWRIKFPMEAKNLDSQEKESSD